MLKRRRKLKAFKGCGLMEKPNIKELLNGFIKSLKLSKDYQREDISETTIELKYQDGYETEIITLEINLNEYNVPIWQLWIEKAEIDNELIYPESCHDCDGSCEYFKNDECTVEDITEKEVTKWKNLEKLEFGKTGYNDFTNVIETSILEEHCFLDVPHYHYYKAIRIYTKDSDHNHIRNMINARDILRDVYMEYLAKEVKKQ